MNTEELKKGEKVVLEYLHDYLIAFGYSPYTADFRRMLDLAFRKKPGTTSGATVKRYIDKLELLGYIRVERKNMRARPGRIKINYEKIAGFDQKQTTT